MKPVADEASNPRYTFKEVDLHAPSKSPMPPRQRARPSYLEVEEKGAPAPDLPRKGKSGNYVNASRSSRDAAAASEHVPKPRVSSSHNKRMKSIKANFVTVSWPIGQLKGKLKNELVSFLA